MANGKKKGSKNERELSKWWQLWTGMEFTRVPASGGLRWKKTDNISGDIVCADPRGIRKFPFTVEAKSYKDINFEHLLLDNKNIKVLQFWEQACEDAQRAGKEPLLFMRYNGMPKSVWYVIMNLKTFNLLHSKNRKKINKYIILEIGLYRLVMMSTNELKETDYTQFYKLIKKELKSYGKNTR